MKKTIALLIAAMMLVSLFAACTNGGNAPTPAPAESTPAAAVSEPAAATPEPAAEETSAEAEESSGADLLKVSIGGEFRVAPNDCEFGLYIQERFGIIIETVDTSEDKVKMLAAANNLPDIFGVTIMENFTTQLREDGMIREIPDSILSKYPNVKSLITTKALNCSDLYAATGKAYFLPTVNDPDLGLEPFHHAFRYRVDWMEKTGIAKEPTTMDEFADMLRAFTFNDPNGDGSVTYGYTGWVYGPWFYPWCDYEDWIYEDGQWIKGCFSKGAREALVFINGLFKEGIIDPEFANADGQALFTEDKVGVICARWDEYGVDRQVIKQWAPAHEHLTGGDDLKALELVKPLPPLKKDANTPAKWGVYANDPYGKAYSSRVSDELMDRIMEIAEWYADPSSDGRWISNFGFEGKDYFMENGMAVRTLPEDATQLYEVYEFIGVGNIIGPAWGYGTWVAQYDANPTYPLELRENVAARKAAQAPFMYTFRNDINSVSTPAKDEFPGDDFEDEFMAIIATQGDAGAEFDAYLDRLTNIYGLQKMYDEVNAIFGAP